MPPTPTPVTITDWKGEYYDNVSLQGSPKVVRNDRVVDFNLPKGTAPATNMPSENWSARWSRTWRFDEGNYRFHLLVDDGARLWVDNRLLIDAWTDGSTREYTAEIYLQGNDPIKLEYYNRLGDARVRLNWEPVTQYSGWKGSYYAVRDLTGLPVFQRDDANIDFNWGTGSPRADVPADNFSVRWVRRLNFQAGQYRFEAFSDDGVRVYVDNTLVIDAWKDGQSSYGGTVQLSAGQHEVRVDYYEHIGQALIELTWTQQSGPTATPTATRTTTPPSATPTATPTTKPPTATPTVTPTTRPPTATPTEPPPIGKPSIVLEPDAGPIGRPFNVIGRGWPAGATVDLFLVRPGARSGGPAAQATADGQGNFQVEMVIPAGAGWEGEELAQIRAVSPDVNATAGAVYRIRPELKSIRFTPIPANDERFALAGPLYLALNSAEAWAQWFGDAPPAPSIDWGRDVVLGAFLGPDAAGSQLVVLDVVQRSNNVVVKLSTAASGQGQGSGQSGIVVGGQGNAQNRGGTGPRAMVRVSRQALEEGTRAGLTYMFVNAQGTLLAQGPAGAAALPPTGLGVAMSQAPEAALAMGVGGGLTETQAAKVAPDSGATEPQALAAAASGALTETQALTVSSELPREQAQEPVVEPTAPAGVPAATVLPAAVDQAAGISPTTVLLIAVGALVLIALALLLFRRYV